MELFMYVCVIVSICVIGTGIFFILTDSTDDEKPTLCGDFYKVSATQFIEDFKKSSITPNGISDALTSFGNIKLPQRATVGSAGYDFYSPVDFTLKPNESIVFPTGVGVEMDRGWVLKIYPRSGLGFKTGVRLANTVGIVDEDYSLSDNEGHIMIKLVNHGNTSLHVQTGNRVAQGVFVSYGITYNDNVTAERNGGFGSSGR